MFLPMSDATKRPTGKLSSIRDWPDDEDDSDIDVIEPVEAVPLSFAFLESANPGGHIHEDPPLATGEPVPVVQRRSVEPHRVLPPDLLSPQKGKRRPETRLLPSE